MFERLTVMAQRRMAAHLREGGRAIDATAGKGYDTEFLARAVGNAGKVFAFDVQEAALAATRRRLDAAGLLGRVECYHAGHERMGELLPAEEKGRICAITFNLGYLPLGDPVFVTGRESTLTALDQAMDLLAKDGILTVMAYPSHEGGAEETRAVTEWFEARKEKVDYYPSALPQGPGLWVLSLAAPPVI